MRRLQHDDQFSAAGEAFRFKYVIKSLLDLKTWISGESSSTFFIFYFYFYFYFERLTMG